MLEIIIRGSSLRTLRDQLLRWFDPEAGGTGVPTPKKLVVEDSGGAGDRYVYAICESLVPAGEFVADVFMATLSVHGDVRWRKTSETSSYKWVLASGTTWTVTNAGTDDAYPKILLQPTDAKTGSYLYKRWLQVKWRASAPYSKYPVDITNDSFATDALVGAGKMQADGDDLRVWVDGVEVDRWLDGINTATTKVWCNLDFQANPAATLTANIAGGGTVDTIDVNESVAGFPSAGILAIDSEAFTYTGKNNSLQRFTGVVRAAKGTSMAAHSAGATVWWIQHDIWILYGNAAATVPTVNGHYEPAFELDHSVNTSWVYEEFGENDGLRPGQWASAALFDSPYPYTANHAAYADPWEEIGLRCVPTAWGQYKAYNPCGITNANFTNGEKWVEYLTASAFVVALKSSIDGTFWTTEYDIPIPSTTSTWEAWSRNEALGAGSLYVALDVRNDLPAFVGYDCRAEAADCTLTLDASYVPAISIGSEQANYVLACEIENTTTGDKIRVDFIMATGLQLTVDTDAKTVTFNDSVSLTSEFQALTVVGGARRDWLPLRPGNNTLKFTDVGTVGVLVYTNYEERYY